MALELPAPCSYFFGGKREEPGDTINVTWGIRGFPVNDYKQREQCKNGLGPWSKPVCGAV